MTTIRLGVVAHTLRLSYAEQLADKVAAEVISFDDGMLGPNKNHIKVWTNLLQRGGDWLVVLEDDAVPVDDFKYQLMQALNNAPTDIVGLYLGTSYPKAWQRFIKKAIETLMHEGAIGIFLTSLMILLFLGSLRSTVAVFLSIPISALVAFIALAQGGRKWPIDEQITHWARMRGHQISYTRPSLIDHMDGPSTIPARHDGDSRDLPRKAYEVGCRDMWFGTKTIEMP